MSYLSEEFASFLVEERIELNPWPQSFFGECFDNDSTSVLSSDNKANRLRDFHFLKSLDVLDAYANDFGFQWTHLYDDYRKDRYKHLDQFLRLGINPNALSGKVCLDVGCGLGRLSEICLGKAKYVVGVDLSNAVVEAARVIKSPHFVPVQASADNLPIKDCSIDFVYCWGVLHHTENPQKTLTELWRVLRPGGTLAIWVYPRNSPYLKRSLLAHYYSALGEIDMLSLSTSLTSLAHTLQLTSQFYSRILSSDLCFSIKNTKEHTKHILFDGLGPMFHYLLDSEWFNDQAHYLQGLKNIKVSEKPYTVAILQK